MHAAARRSLRLAWSRAVTWWFGARLPAGRALLLPNDDGRVVFVVPFEGEFALIGTTDVALSGDPRGVAISQDEVAYLCRAVNRFLAQPVAERDIVWTYSGVRALHDDGSENPSRVTRDYLLQLDRAENHAPILSVYGGKLTTYRRLAEEAVGKLSRSFPALLPAWTAQAPLPGGDLGGMSMQSFVAALRARYPELPGDWIAGIARRHGALADALIGGACRPEELGVHFGAGLTAREVEYLVRREWAVEADDVLWRRTKAGLHLDDQQREAVARHLRGYGVGRRGRQAGYGTYARAGARRFGPILGRSVPTSERCRTAPACRCSRPAARSACR